MKFAATLNQGAKGSLANWRSKPLGRLAEIILLDHFPRHIYRDRGEAYTFDRQAQSYSLMALVDKAHISLSAGEHTFLLMPLIRSEEVGLQRRGVELLRFYGTKSARESAMRHVEVIKKFGRHPHRNSSLKRKSTKAEKIYLSSPGSRFKRQEADHLGLFRLHRIFSSGKTCSTNFTGEAKTRSCRTILSAVKDYLEM